jgi:hypothetical protein
MRIEEDCTYNSVGHYSASTRWRKINTIIGSLVALFSCIAAFCTFSLPEVAAGLSVVVTVLALADLYFRSGELAANHHRIAGKWNSLRQKARIFREITLAASTIPQRDLLKGIEELLQEKMGIGELELPLPDFAYRVAKKKISRGQASYAADDGTSSLDPAPTIEAPNEVR